MPSSLTEVLSSTLVYSTSPPVSVCGTGTHALTRGFSRRYGLNPCGLPLQAHLPITSQRSCQGICLPAPPTSLEGITPPEPSPPRPPIAQTVVGGTGILTGCPSPTGRPLGLGPPHPQLISMAAEPSGIRCGGFAPPSRYSCRHSHSPPLHLAFQLGFSADGDAPLPWQFPTIRSFGHGLEPRWIVGAAAHSTSELLRTLSRMAATKPTSWLFLHRDYLAHLVRSWGP